ncbi:hypothetical protein B0H66DRAFT_533120 [Apodospora peruviana]|uniref:Uncharacterized protein n=1 Tax=Apodospora peruviana TaxID=516989 RepID=A0AAE0I580_9PEZI|nr:hypothetical protein B0H66DRAFT_533120 [Apodospora peruviana]
MRGSSSGRVTGACSVILVRMHSSLHIGILFLAEAASGPALLVWKLHLTLATRGLLLVTDLMGWGPMMHLRAGHKPSIPRQSGIIPGIYHLPCLGGLHEPNMKEGHVNDGDMYHVQQTVCGLPPSGTSRVVVTAVQPKPCPSPFSAPVRGKLGPRALDSASRPRPLTHQLSSRDVTFCDKKVHLGTFEFKLYLSAIDIGNTVDLDPPR